MQTQDTVPVATRTLYRVTRSGTAPGKTLHGATWHYAICSRCWSERGIEPVGRFPGTKVPNYYPDATICESLSVNVAGEDRPSVKSFLCSDCAADSEAQGLLAVYDSLSGHRAEWRESTCAACKATTATHLLRVFPPKAAYPAVSFLCAACVRTSTRHLTPCP